MVWLREGLGDFVDNASAGMGACAVVPVVDVLADVSTAAAWRVAEVKGGEGELDESADKLSVFVMLVESALSQECQKCG